MALDLCPEVMAEGMPWRFLGIQSKNRKEWFLLHLANMYIGFLNKVRPGEPVDIISTLLDKQVHINFYVLQFKNIQM